MAGIERKIIMKMTQFFYRSRWILGLILMMASLSPHVAAQKAQLYPEFTPLKECKAYVDFLKGPKNDYSKLIFLIDRFGQADIKIVYNGYEFAAPLAAGVAKWFLAAYYHGQTPTEWVYQWCNRSVPGDELIKVKLPDNQYLLGRDVLIRELAALEKEIVTPSAA